MSNNLNSFIGQCPDCCSPCQWVVDKNVTLELTLSGIVLCPPCSLDLLQVIPGEFKTFSVNDVDGGYILTRPGSGGVWTFTSTSAAAHIQSFQDHACTILKESFDLFLTASVQCGSSNITDEAGIYGVDVWIQGTASDGTSFPLPVFSGVGTAMSSAAPNLLTCNLLTENTYNGVIGIYGGSGTASIAWSR